MPTQDNTLPSYIPIIASLIGGGLAGAILTNLITAYRSRIQPIGHRIDIDPILSPKPQSSSLAAKITLQHESRQHTFDNLFLIRLEIANQGNKDHDEFGFGLTLAAGDVAVYLEGTGADRHHSIAPTTPVVPSKPASELDFVCKPFNRGDSYTLSAFVVTSNEAGPSTPRISSKLPVKFVNIPTLGELMSTASKASLLMLEVGTTLRFRRPF